ncbi:MAG TPA: hypothetical protein VFH48_19900 [Chloroflexota bacterium]|nr:hypothetical protein [Chloroflexota bacterium]
MAEVGFPVDEYTPHGYLANPYAVAHSWSEGEGGCLRSSRNHVGFGWQLPWALRAQASVDLVVSLEGDGHQLVTRADFDAAGLISPHHSANLFVYRWQAFGKTWEAAYTIFEPLMLDESNRLGLQVRWEPAPEAYSDPSDVTLTLSLIGWRRDRPVTVDFEHLFVDLGSPFGEYELLVDEGAGQPGVDRGSGQASVEFRCSLTEQPSGAVYALASQVTAQRRRDRRRPLPEMTPPAALAEPLTLATIIQDDIRRARQDNDAFWRGATHLEGDWPTSWRRGWVHDTETTRMCVYPPGGIFTDVWPAWMVQWPRAVVAEGTLDMARFAYASPEIAQRALLSLFRDAEAPNVPCVFQHGEPNMVAKDGSICGTSPAWCIPFYNLERLFSFTLDREWLAEIYPYLARFLEWWLAERTDPGGWAVYKCTWEAGEDDTPRLDPERRGDNVVSAFVRPVELQATMALSAGVLSRFAAVLGKSDDTTRWRQVEAEYLDRTRQLWDPVERRFRDWDARAGRFVAPAPDEPNYWGIDPCRYSALAFTPLLAGLADDEVRAGLRSELQHYGGPPWTLWASWSYVVLEAAPRAGDHSFAGRVAAEIVGRVYDELDARQIVDPRHPTPGVAREYWPLDLDTWASCEGYGWGANTASLLVRQVFGFTEGPYLDAATPLTFELRPALPDAFLTPRREYWLTNLPYRGARISLGYRVADAPPDADGSFSALEMLVSADVPTRCRVVDLTAPLAWESDGAENLHEIPARIGGEYVVELHPDS